MTLALAGCWQKSVSPFYTAKDIVAEPALAGVWREPKSPDASGDDDRPIWEFVDGGGKRFDLVIRSKTEQYAYDAYVFKLGASRFLDVGAKARSVSGVPAHHLFKLAEISPDLKLAALNPDWMQKWLRKNPGSLAHMTLIDPEHRDDRDKDELVLTADTAALQRFVREHADDEDFFVEPLALKRQSNAALARERK
jgi:hypothetical protein